MEVRNRIPRKRTTGGGEEEDDELWLGSLSSRGGTSSSPTSSEPSSPISSTLSHPILRPNTKQRRRFQLPDPQTLNPALYVAALNDLLQPYLRTLRLGPYQLPPPPHDEEPSDDKKYDLSPPPAYSELFPVEAVGKQVVVGGGSKFSLATRLSLRGRSFLRWTGMAGDAGLSKEEIEFLRREDNTRRKTWTRDYMLLFFWVHPHSLSFTFFPSFRAYADVG